MIASAQFRNFKALRAARVDLGPFNLVIGPNGSGKSTLLESVADLGLARRGPALFPGEGFGGQGGSEVLFSLGAPWEGVRARLTVGQAGASRAVRLEGERPEDWGRVGERLGLIKGYWLDHRAMAAAAPVGASAVLESQGGNLAAVLAGLERSHAGLYARLAEEALRLMPGFTGIVIERQAEGMVGLRFSLSGQEGSIPAGALSQGTLYTLALVTLSFLPAPPPVVCIEEVDRGIHPRQLREIRDALYRLSHPEAAGLDRPPVQVILTSHSPFLVDLFRDHPEEVIVARREGGHGGFARLGDFPDLPALMNGASLGDLWFSGLLGGVPTDP